MESVNLLDYKKNVISQNGEDGIIEQIFKLVGDGNKICCEFGGWDGIHLSNTRHLIQQGWTGIFVEGNPARHNEAVANYADNAKVHCINSFVDATENSLSSLLKRAKIEKLGEEMDLLSIDIDGLDYEILRTLDLKPRLICVEVNAGHSPMDPVELPRRIAIDNIGQSLAVFNQIAAEKGYSLIAYSGNAFYLRNDVQKKFEVPVITAEQAYEDFLDTLTGKEKVWLYLVNLGLVPPYHQYRNPLLSAKQLGIYPVFAFLLRSYTRIKTAIYSVGKFILKPLLP